MGTRYIWDREQRDWVPPRPRLVEGAGPMIWNDYEGYVSPATGKWIEGRAARRYDLEASGCIDANDFVPPGGGKMYTDPRHRQYDSGYAQDFERDRRQRYGERVLTEWTPQERERMARRG